jgi:ubiquinone/menaquinone biosynthesis C-methylase UbiE
LAETTKFADAEFDVVTASLLFHETPSAVAQQVLQEAYRLLKPGGQIVILDGHQKTLRNTTWLSDIFEEPYIKEYAAGSVDAWMGKAGFNQVLTEDVWWTNQLTTGVKSSSN